MLLLPFPSPYTQNFYSFRPFTIDYLCYFIHSLHLRLKTAPSFPSFSIISKLLLLFFPSVLTINSLPSAPSTVPPRRLAIYDDLGVLVGRSVGPLLERDTLRLTCRARGGSPLPTVTWWEAATPLDLNMEVQELPEVNNLLVVPKLTRDDLGRTFVCQASNSNLTAPLLSTVTLDMNCKALLRTSLDALSHSSVSQSFTRSNHTYCLPFI